MGSRKELGTRDDGDDDGGSGVGRDELGGEAVDGTIEEREEP